MNELTPILEQARQFASQHLPAAALDEAVPAAVLCLLFGIGISVLGARLARFGTALAFAVAGGFVGHFLARQTGFAPPLCVAGGALVVGTIGYQTFRLWVGLATAIVFASIALGVFSQQRVLPYVGQFEQAMPQVTQAGDNVFTPPSPAQQEAYRNRTPQQWARQFWAFLKQQDARLAQNGRALTVAALLTGLCVGVVAVRFALILSTSLLGTGLVATGMGTLLAVLAQEEASQALQKHPGIVGMALGGFFTTSLLLQTMLTRPAPKAQAAGRAKTKSRV